MNMENFLMYMDYEINPNQIFWIIRQNSSNDYYLDVGTCIGFKVFKERNKNEYCWKIGIRSILTNKLIYSKVSNLNNTLFFDMKEAMSKLSSNKHAVILHFRRKYKFYDNHTCIIDDIEKTKFGVIYHCLDTETNNLRKISNLDITKYIIDFID